MNERLFRRGYAIGHSDIRGDCLHFRFYDEFFIVFDRALKTRPFRKHLVAKIADVRKLAHG